MIALRYTNVQMEPETLPHFSSFFSTTVSVNAPWPSLADVARMRFTAVRSEGLGKGLAEWQHTALLSPVLAMGSLPSSGRSNQTRKGGDAL